MRSDLVIIAARNVPAMGDVWPGKRRMNEDKSETIPLCIETDVPSSPDPVAIFLLVSVLKGQEF